MQYKEDIWTALEKEIRKVVSKDSQLLEKVQKKTRILTECLAQNKVSTVVNQNAQLKIENGKACSLAKRLIENIKEVGVLISSDRCSSTVKLDEIFGELGRYVEAVKEKVKSLQSENQYYQQELNAATKNILAYVKTTPTAHKNSEQSTRTGSSGNYEANKILKPVKGIQLRYDQQIMMPLGGSHVSMEQLASHVSMDQLAFDIQMSEIKLRRQGNPYEDDEGNLSILQSPFIDLNLL